MTLIVGALPHCQWQRLSPLLEAMGWDGNSSDVETWYIEKPYVNTNSGVCYVLLHSRPERCIAQALMAGADFKAAVTDWQKSAEALLAFFKRNRSHSILLDVDAVCEAPNTVLEWLATNRAEFKAVAEAALSRPVKLGSVQDGQALEGNLYLLMATQAVLQSAEIQVLLPYYEAGSIPVGKNTYARPFIDLMSMYERIKNVTQDKELKEENDLIIKELFKVQEELERYYLDNKDLRAKLDYATSEMEKFSRDKQKEIVSIRNSLRDKERDLVKKDRQLESLERKYNEVNQAFLRVQNSLFWRLTFPLRWSLSRVKKVGSLFGSRAIRKQAKLVRESDLFDAEWYLAKYPDIAESGAKPEVHYVRFGASEGRDPGPYFSSKNYLQANPDVAKAGLNPLAHYIQHGKSEGRRLT